MTQKNTRVSILTIIIVVSTFASMGHTKVSADPLSLPSRLVTIEAFNSTRAYFETKLTDVPDGYDISSGTYLGWCIDCSVEMQRSPATHQVTLYSSLSSKPGNLENQKWDMVNYILNHKQGSPLDVQEAIWYFINLNGGYSSQSSLAMAMVDDAVANGAGFVPNDTQAVAVICYPMVMQGEEKVQVTIIEVVAASNNNHTPNNQPPPIPEAPTPPPQQTSEPSLPTNPNPDAAPTSPPPENSLADDSWLGLEGLAIVSAVCLVGLILLFKKRKRVSGHLPT